MNAHRLTLLLLLTILPACVTGGGSVVPSIHTAKVKLLDEPGLAFELEVIADDMPGETLTVQVDSPGKHIEDFEITLDDEGVWADVVRGKCTGRGSVLVRVRSGGKLLMLSNQSLHRCLF